MKKAKVKPKTKTPRQYGVYPSDGTHIDSQGKRIPVGKVPCGCYHVSLPAATDFTDAMVRELFPLAHGRTVTATRITRNEEALTWRMLLNFRRQSTQADISKRIAAMLGWKHADTRIHVHRDLGLPEQGGHSHEGTPRKGTKHRRKVSKSYPTISTRLS